MDWKSRHNKVLPENLQPGDRIRDLNGSDAYEAGDEIGVDDVEINDAGAIIVHTAGNTLYYQAGYQNLRYAL